VTGDNQTVRGETVKPDQIAEPANAEPNDPKISRQALNAQIAELVRLAQSGDHIAFEKLVQPHMRRTYQVTLRITRNREDAEDAAQQTFLKAFANIRQFQGASQFSTWLTRIAMNEAFMVMRKRRQEDLHLAYDGDSADRVAAVERISAAESSQPEVLYARSEHHAALHEAVAGLRGTLRAVVWLLGFSERNSKDAAQILSLSESAVKVRYSRARRELRECLADRL
jgi:RNA polymerase sigma-70 factor, ECF subfamily